MRKDELVRLIKTNDGLRNEGYRSRDVVRIATTVNGYVIERRTGGNRHAVPKSFLVALNADEAGYFANKTVSKQKGLVNKPKVKPLKLTFDGYSSNLQPHTDTVSFGCKTITLEQLRALKTVFEMRRNLNFYSIRLVGNAFSNHVEEDNNNFIVINRHMRIPNENVSNNLSFRVRLSQIDALIAKLGK